MATPGRSQQSPDQLRTFIHTALTSKAGTEHYQCYEKLCQDLNEMRGKAELSSKSGPHKILAGLVNALKDYVTLIQQPQHEKLLTLVLGIKLWSANPVLRSALLDFITNLVVVNTVFMPTCLRLLVASLLPPATPPPEEPELGPWAPSEDELMVQRSITGALVKVVSLVPTAPAVLVQTVASHLPHRTRDRNAQCLFLSAVFTLAESPGGRTIRDALLAAVVEHLMSLDVELRWEYIVDKPSAEAVEEEDHAAALEEDPDAIFELEGLTELDLNATPEELEQQRLERQQQAARLVGAEAPRGGWEGGGASGAGTAAALTPEQREEERKRAVELADKLDSMMELTFAHLERRCGLDGGRGPALTWSGLLASFDRTILHAHRCKFSQYLVFYMCCKQGEHCTKPFTEYLHTRLTNLHFPAISRSASAAYLASFTARCASLSLASIYQCVDSLVNYAHQYLNAEGSMAGQVSLNSQEPATCLTTKHQVFYATVQGVLYILCYHLSHLLNHQHQHQHKQTLAQAVGVLLNQRLQPLLTHPLNPLGVCNPTVVLEFRRQLKRHKFTDLWALVNNAVTQSTRTDSASAQRPLEMFFPFDPYLLSRSSRYLDLDNSYMHWHRGGARRVAGSNGAAEASVSDADSEDESAEVSVNTRKAAARDEDLHLDEESAEEEEDPDTVSSDDMESGSYRDGSMASGSVGAGMMLSSLPKSYGLLPRSTHLSSLTPHPHHPWAHHHRPPASRTRGGSGTGHLMGTSYDPMAMATSYGTMAMSSVGDITPTGTSPVMVDYPMCQSPMMGATPQTASHMNRLAART